MTTQALKLFPRGRMRLKENVEYQLRDKDGNAKKLFADNGINRAIFQFFRQLAKNRGIALHNEDGTARKGVLQSLALYGLRIPFITGRWVDKLPISNLVTNAGMAGVASRINGDGSEAVFDEIAIGTGTTAANVADTALETEITTGGGARATATASRVTTDVTNDTARLVHTFNFTSSFAVTESGVLNAASSGVLLCRQVFSAINVANGDSLQVTWDVDVD